MTPTSRRAQRGAALILAVIVILVVTVIGVGMLRIGTREMAGASAGARRQAVVSCAEAARQLLLSRFHALGVSPYSLEPLNVPLDGAAGAQVFAVGGHIGEDPAKPSALDPLKTEVQITQVTPLPENAFGPTTSVRDLTNIVERSGQGGKPMKITVHCVDHGDGTPTGGRQLEIEFGVRFGL